MAKDQGDAGDPETVANATTAISRAIEADNRNWQESAIEGLENAVRGALAAGVDEKKIADAVECTLPARRYPSIDSFYFEDLALNDVEPVDWLVKNIFPMRAVTGFFGDGGTGKDLLLFMLGTAATTDNKWLGRDVKQGRVIYFSVEDDWRELRRRQKSIMDHYGLKAFPFESRRDFKIISFAGQDSVLAAFDRKEGIVKPMPLFERVKIEIEEFQPTLVIFPNKVNAFSVEQMSDVQARQCIQLLSSISLDVGCAAILPAHPSLSGMESGAGTSGTVQWSNAVRARTFLSRVIENKVEPDTDARMLETKKANWGPTGEKINLRWSQGVFIVDDGKTIGIGKNTIHARAEQVFLEMLDAYNADRRYVGATPSSNYAPAVFSRDARAKGVRRRELSDAMNRLFASEEIANEEFGPPSKRRIRIVRGAAKRTEGTD